MRHKHQTMSYLFFKLFPVIVQEYIVRSRLNLSGHVKVNWLRITDGSRARSWPG